MTTLSIRAHGIPALARVTSFIPFTPSSWSEPADGPEVEWQLLDRNGRPAPWLERMVTATERRAIEADLINRLDRYEEEL